ncbi:MAG: hypothetical protein AAF074_20150, partial [Pseudomonadota bacterium]
MIATLPLRDMGTLFIWIGISGNAAPGLAPVRRSIVRPHEMAIAPALRSGKFSGEADEKKAPHEGARQVLRQVSYR